MHSSQHSSPGKRIVCYWSRTRETLNNFGDALNPFILEALSGKPVDHYNDCSQLRKCFSPMLFCIGSILERNKLSHRLRAGEIHVWGTGTRGESSLAHLKRARIHAVRGPLTRKKLLEEGIACPEIYGDPAVLLPQIIQPTQASPSKISVMPHYVDVTQCQRWLIENGLVEQVNVIDVMSPIADVVAQISSSGFLLSSSLHGLIVADAYGVANARIRFGNNIVGGDFKFHDYFLSVDRPLSPPIDGSKPASVENLIAQCRLGDTTSITDIGGVLPGFCR